MKWHNILLLASTAAALAACGGGNDSTVSPVSPAPAAAPTQVPTSAMASPTAYRQFVASLPASETAQPLDLSTLSRAPTSETEAPDSL